VHQARHRNGPSVWIFRPRALAAVAVAATGLAVAIWLPGRNDDAEAFERRRGATVGSGEFADDFSGRRGLDESKWLLFGQGRDSGARVDDGLLTVGRLLAARPRFGGAFGHAEARIRVDRDAGVWRAFAALGDDRRALAGEVEPIEGGIDPTSGRSFHTYEIDWTPETVTWTVDGKPSLRLVRAEPGEPLTLALNLATGGRSSNRMVVDFVQVVTGDEAPPPASPSPSPTATATPTTPPTPSAEPTTPSAEPTTPSPTPTSESPEPTPTSPPPAQEATAWKTFTDYAAGDLVIFEDVTYRVLEAHTSLPGWEPTNLPNLFAEV
jgi:hypothetical protein